MSNLTIEKIEETFKNGFKQASELKVGVELERLPISAKNFQSVSYSKENGIKELLRSFAKSDEWEYITDDYNIIGLKKGEDKITLEPGCQFELSLKPEEKIENLKTKICEFNKKIKPLLRKLDINLLEYGISPVSTYRFINLIPKRRYQVMAQYLWGILSDVMMRETAGIQACYDFTSEQDAMRKFRLANLISPFMTAMCANSPIRGGVDTGYKTFRGLSWLNTDNERCKFVSKNLFENKDYRFRVYIEDVIKTPVIFIVRDNKLIKINGKLTFEEFMKQGYEGYSAEIEDFELHANLFFPDVRLRNFIEIRNHDCSNHGMQYSILALYKGVLYNDEAMSECEKLLEKFKYNQISELRYNVPRLALEAKIGKYSVKEISKELLKISQNSLRIKSENEERFLEPVIDLVLNGMSPADVIIKNWNGTWNKEVSKLIAFLNEG